MAASLSNNPYDAEDVYQEAMLAAFKNIASFKMQSQFSTWLYRIVVNTAMSLGRKLKNKINSLIFNQSSLAGDDESANQASIEYYMPGDSRIEPESALFNSELSLAISDGLSQLSDKERLAFTLCQQQELKIKDTAWIMGCTEGAVKNYLFRGRQKMQLHLQEFR
ncbi:MAG: RNA polymerase sigma factor [Enterobacterales bacterium]|nr:RNA polymerase sigma factor [Enterobacterales bacterium]